MVQVEQKPREPRRLHTFSDSYFIASLVSVDSTVKYYRNLPPDAPPPSMRGLATGGIIALDFEPDDFHKKTHSGPLFDPNKEKEMNSDAPLSYAWWQWMVQSRRRMRTFAHMIRGAQGLGCITVTVNRDGTVYGAVPCPHNDRGYAMEPLSNASNQRLSQIVSRFGRFAPFPRDSRLQTVNFLLYGIYH